MLETEQYIEVQGLDWEVKLAEEMERDREALPMGVKVRFLGTIRQSVGKDQLILSLDPCKTYKIGDILREVIESGGKDLSTILVEMQKKSRETVRVIVNGKEISSLDGFETEVQDGDQITIFPLLAGG